MAQSLPTVLTLTQTQTFGMAGVAVNQTARLNVVNIATPPATANPVAPAPCKVTLDIFDDQNARLEELAIDDLAPGKAMHLDYPRPVSTSPSTPLRVQVRGVVTTSPTFPPTAMQGPAIPLPLPSFACTVVSTLEVFDSDTGKSQIILANAAAVPGMIQPLLTAPAGTP